MSENKIVFATKETLVQPAGGNLIVEKPEEQDHVLGATGPEFEVLVSDGHWSKYAPMHELQRNKNGDTFMCVTFSLNNIHEFLHIRLHGSEINKSDIALGVMSGTVRGQGNSKRAVVETNRTKGFVFESDYPYTPEMTLDQVYAAVPASITEKALKNLDLYEFGYKWLGSNTPKALLEGCKFSPLQVDVNSRYRMNAKNHVVWNKADPTYDHEVTLFDYEQGVCWWIFDSESMQFLKFDWNYPFGSPMIHSLKKKMKPQLFKKIGSSAIAVKHSSEPSMIAFSGGSVAGEELFKSIYGVSSFKEIPIIEVKEWPHPIRHLINTNPQR